jgi:hypothetical protein
MTRRQRFATYTTLKGAERASNRIAAIHPEYQFRPTLEPQGFRWAIGVYDHSGGFVAYSARLKGSRQ